MRISETCITFQLGKKEDKKNQRNYYHKMEYNSLFAFKICNVWYMCNCQYCNFNDIFNAYSKNVLHFTM